MFKVSIFEHFQCLEIFIWKKEKRTGRIEPMMETTSSLWISQTIAMTPKNKSPEQSFEDSLQNNFVNCFNDMKGEFYFGFETFCLHLSVHYQIEQ